MRLKVWEPTLTAATYETSSFTTGAELLASDLKDERRVASSLTTSCALRVLAFLEMGAVRKLSR